MLYVCTCKTKTAKPDRSGYFYVYGFDASLRTSDIVCHFVSVGGEVAARWIDDTSLFVTLADKSKSEAVKLHFRSLPDSEKPPFAILDYEGYERLMQEEEEEVDEDEDEDEDEDVSIMSSRSGDMPTRKRKREEEDESKKEEEEKEKEDKNDDDDNLEKEEEEAAELEEGEIKEGEEEDDGDEGGGDDEDEGGDQQQQQQTKKKKLAWTLFCVVWKKKKEQRERERCLNIFLKLYLHHHLRSFPVYDIRDGSP